MSSKKVLLLRHKLTAFGGAELIYIKEAEWFAANGYEVSLMAFELSDAFRERLSGFRLLPAGKGFWRQVADLRAHLRRESFDAVLAHENGHIHLLMATFGLPRRPKLLLNWYGSFLWLAGSRLNSSWFHRRNVNRLMRDWPGHREFQDGPGKRLGFAGRFRAELQAMLDFMAIRNFDHIVTCSEYAKKECRLIYGRRADIVPGGVDTDFFAPLERPAARRELGLPESAKIVFTVNRLDPRKRITFLVRVIRSLLPKEKDLLLLIAGTGPEEAGIRKAAEGTEDAVMLAGFVPDERLPLYYAAADVVAYPAWCAWGLVPLEALSMNRKTAVSKDAIIAEAVEELPNVAVSDPTEKDFAEAITRLLEQQDQDSRSRVKEAFDWDIYFSKIKALCEN